MALHKILIAFLSLRFFRWCIFLIFLVSSGFSKSTYFKGIVFSAIFFIRIHYEILLRDTFEKCGCAETSSDFEIPLCCFIGRRHVNVGPNWVTNFFAFFFLFQEEEA